MNQDFSPEYTPNNPNIEQLLSQVQDLEDPPNQDLEDPPPQPLALKEKDRQQNETSVHRDTPPQSGTVPKVIPPAPQVQDKGDGTFEILYSYVNNCWKCQHCRFSSNFKENAMEHLRTRHMNTNLPSAGGTALKLPQFKCKKCPAQFPNKKLLALHGKRDHSLKGEEKETETVTATATAEEEAEASSGGKPINYKCSNCSQGFTYKKNYELHEPFCIDELQCQYCKKVKKRRNTNVYKFKYNFKRHEENCATKVPKSKDCQYCQKSFASHRNAKNHLQWCAVYKELVAKEELAQLHPAQPSAGAQSQIFVPNFSTVS